MRFQVRDLFGAWGGEGGTPKPVQNLMMGYSCQEHYIMVFETSLKNYKNDVTSKTLCLVHFGRLFTKAMKQN